MHAIFFPSPSLPHWVSHYFHLDDDELQLLGVVGIIVVNHEGIPIRTTLDPETTVQYAALVTRFTEKTKTTLAQINPEVQCPTAHCPSHRIASHRIGLRIDFVSFPFSLLFFLVQNEPSFIRIRSKKHEIMITPDENYILLVIQRPAVN